ncbi:hypothetical protein [Palleronia abyssalis]|uniref:Uncharacterized protein n=1 Tax=Palleronia abyssalis TaxID=1501240 RepID=A0A2R8BVS0_9RHOB|nr:hypothetical protein [Palleronia abyssalis]SPJ24262.1 hypothetical protein PAA8504_02090 [Palleronia abyssalis]
MGDTVEIRALAITRDGIEGPYSQVAAHVIGSDNAALPTPLDAGAVTVEGLPGHARTTVAVPDESVAAILICRTRPGASPDIVDDALGAPRAVGSASTAYFVDGDATRTSLLADGTFDLSGDWTVGPGWTISAGSAQQAPGDAGDLVQTLALEAGETYRLAVTIAGIDAGEIVPQLAGDTVSAGAGIAALGRSAGTLMAPATPTALILAASATFDGTIDDVLLYRETAACAPPGAWEYWLAPVYAEGIHGPLVGPFPAFID